MISVAQTNIQLYNQLRGQGRPLDELRLVHRSYELLTTLYSCHFQVDGKPFVAHGVGVASIFADLCQPAEMLAVGLLHNIYGNADFGDGRRSCVTAARRRLVREAVGEEIEQLLVRFREVRVQLLRNLPETLQTLPQRSETDRRLMLLEVVDFVEKYVDLGVLYYGARGQDMRAARAERRASEIARALGDERLTELLSAAVSDVHAAEGAVPPALYPSDRRGRTLQLIPRSCRRRLTARARIAIASLRDRVQLRTRLRRALTGDAQRRGTSPS